MRRSVLLMLLLALILAGCGQPSVHSSDELQEDTHLAQQLFLADFSRNYEVLYEGEVKWKEPDYYELHVIYQLEEPAKMTEEETTMEIKEDHTEKNDSPVKRQGPFWYLVRTGLMITVAIGILGLFIGQILLVVMKRRSRKDRS